MSKSNGSDESLLPKRLHEQVDSLIDFLQEYNTLRLMPRDEKDYTFLRDFFQRYLADQNNRSDEVRSSNYRQALALAKKQFPHKPHWVLCVDGRVLVVLAYGGTADIDDSIRVPGGMLREFVRGVDGKMFLREDSNFGVLLKRALENSPTHAVIEIFDSHLGCAARRVEEEAKGKYPSDAGLLSDIHHKKQMVSATHKFVRKKYGTEKYVIAIQTSFDPHTGFMYMGFETEKAMEYATDHGRAFTADVIHELVGRGIILSAEAIASDLKVREVFNKYDFNLAWKHDYVKSATQFWSNVEKMKPQLFPLLKNLVLQIYPDLKDGGEKKTEELEARCLLLLTNAYCGYLENIHPEKSTQQTNAHMDDEHNDHLTYSYGIHEEEGVRVSEGGYPPYEISMFTVFSLDLVNLPMNIELAVSLVRSNRKDGRVHDRSGTFTDSQEFIHAPVPIAYHELVRDSRLTSEDWEEVLHIDWSDLPKMSWETMDEEAFEAYLERKGRMSQSIANGIKRLRHKMMVLYNPSQAISHHLVNQDEVVLPVLADRGRKIQCVIPFVKLGYEVTA